MMFLAAAAENATDLVNISIPNAAIVALLGYAVVFFGLILLMIVVTVMGKIFIAKDKKAAEKAAAAKASIPAAAAPVAVAPVAPVAAPAPVGKLSPAKFDDETVAVITAAIAAVRGEGYPFQIKRIVRVKQ